MKILLLRCYYGISVHSDAHGELGVPANKTEVVPDLTFIMAGTILSQFHNVNCHIIDAIAERKSPKKVFEELHDNYDIIYVKSSQCTFLLDMEMVKRLRKFYPDSMIKMAGHIVKIIHDIEEYNQGIVNEFISEPLDFYVYKKLNKTDKVMLEEFPTPDYSLFPVEKYVDCNGKSRIFLQTSRGCPMNCSYCPYNHYYKELSVFSVKKTIWDIKIVKEKYKPNIIQFRDQYFSADKGRTIEICKKMIKENIKIPWICETRLDTLDKETIDWMVKAGMSMICFGVESGDDELLLSYNRIFKNFGQIKEIVSYLKSKNILTLAFYIIGFPEDTWKTAEKTFFRAVELDSDIAVFSKYQPFTQILCQMKIDKLKNYSNELEYNGQSFLSSDEIDYLIEAYNLIYNHNKKRLKDNYYNAFFPEKQKNKFIENLIKMNGNLDLISELIDGQI